MIKENKIYEYFKMDEVYFTGKYKTYVDALWVQNKIQESMFKRLVDLYAISAIIGLRIDRKLDNDYSDEKRTIQLKQLNEAYNTLIPIMRLILIFDQNRGLSAEERLDSAFRNPENEEIYKCNMDLFNSYSRGGLEFLYEELIVRSLDIDEKYTDRRIGNIIALMKNPLIPDLNL